MKLLFGELVLQMRFNKLLVFPQFIFVGAVKLNFYCSVVTMKGSTVFIALSPLSSIVYIFHSVVQRDR